MDVEQAVGFQARPLPSQGEEAVGLAERPFAHAAKKAVGLETAGPLARQRREQTVGLDNGPFAAAVGAKEAVGLEDVALGLTWLSETF